MKRSGTVLLTLAILALSGPALSQGDKTVFELVDGKPVQSSDDFKSAPTRINTDFGTLEFTGGGYPKAATSKLIWDQMDLQRATQAYYDFMPALSLHGILKAQARDFGALNSSDVLVFAAIDGQLSAPDEDPVPLLLGYIQRAEGAKRPVPTA